MAANLKYGFLDSASDSSGLRSGTASWLGREGQPIQLASLYGLIHNPPAGSQVLLLPQNGQESNSIGLADHPSIRPVKDLATGEIGICNYLTGAYVILRETGNIEVFSPAGDLVLNITGNLTATITGDMTVTVTGNLTATAAQISANGVTIDPAGNISTAGTVTAAAFIPI